MLAMGGFFMLAAWRVPWVAERDKEEVMVRESQIPLSARAPDNFGAVRDGSGDAVMDASNAGNGYLLVSYSGKNPKIKVQIIGKTVYTYDLHARGAYEVYPFTEGNGNYTIKIFENVGGNQYSQLMSQTIFVSLSNEFVPFLYPNQYVNYNSDSHAAALAARLTAGKNQLGVVDAVYKYVIANISYDYEKAQSVQSGYLPDIDETLASGKGICFDYAALMTAMLRSRDIPAKLVIGYAGEVYHAWVSVYTEEKGWIDNMIWFDGKNWSYMDPTFMSTGKNSERSRQFAGNRDNYRERYSY